MRGRGESRWEDKMMNEKRQGEAKIEYDTGGGHGSARHTADLPPEPHEGAAQIGQRQKGERVRLPDARALERRKGEAVLSGRPARVHRRRALPYLHVDLVLRRVPPWRARVAARLPAGGA